MPVAFDLGPTYLGAHLSDNVAETPEGYRICRNAVIGRSGFQTYRVSELTDPDGLLADRTGADEVPVWRDASEVFSPATLASFEGKTFTISHPSDLLGPDSEREHHAGHVQNVRKGPEPLESGDWPMLADIIVTDRDAINAIDAGERQLSCGYTYRLAKEGYRFDQRAIVGNHVALVPKGRAGHEARINDAAPTEENSVKNKFWHVFGIGLKDYAKDAKPEDLAEALAEGRQMANDSIVDKGKGNLVEIGETADGVKVFKRIAADADPDPAMDQKAKDRKRMHDALDKQLDSAETEQAAKSEEDDATMDAIRNLFKGKDEEAHPDDCDCADCKAGKDAAEGKVEESQDASVVSAEPVLPSEDLPQSQFDSAHAVIKALKPFIAKSKDAKLKKAFDTATQSIAAAQKNESAGGDYAAFTAASRSRGSDAVAESPEQKQCREADEMFTKERENRSSAFRAQKR